MRKKEIEKKLNMAISNSVPDVLDNILTKCEEKKGFKKVTYMEKENKTKNNRGLTFKLASAIAVIVICVCGVFGFNRYNKIYKTDTIIEFDVNPSIELNVNKEEEVIEAIALNTDGKKVLEDMDLERVDLDVAVNAIIGSMLKQGYISIDENSILVSVKNNDKEKANKLKEELSKEIEEILSANSIKGSVLSQTYEEDATVKKTAQENDLSEGKVQLINKVLKSNIKNSKGEDYTFESLSKLSINELNVLLNSKKVEVKDVKTSGTASESSYIGKEKAKEIALNNAKVAVSKAKGLEVEFDCDDGKLVYEVEFNTTDKEYDYEIDAKTGAILKSDVDNERNNNTSTNTNKNENTNNTNTNNSNNNNTNTSTSKNENTTNNSTNNNTTQNNNENNTNNNINDRYDDDRYDDDDDDDDRYDDDDDDDRYDDDDDDDRYDD